jgi:hypothetical protein
MWVCATEKEVGTAHGNPVGAAMDQWLGQVSFWPAGQLSDGAGQSRLDRQKLQAGDGLVVEYG